MKWTKPAPNEIRYREKFLFFPKTIGEETRWLEVAYWAQAYEYWGINAYGDKLYRWKDKKWLTFSEYYFKEKTLQEVIEERYG